MIELLMSEASERLQRLPELLDVAWQHQSRSFHVGPTEVGSAVLAENGSVFGGCNVEHPFRIFDVHAEINAISTMIAVGCRRLRAIV